MIANSDLSLEHRVALMSQEEQDAILSGVDMDELAYDWGWNGRPSQTLPLDMGQSLFLALAGRGFGKTLMGAQWIRETDAKWSTLGQDTSHLRVALLGRTAADVRDTMLEGPSGLLNVYPPSLRDRVTWTPSRRRVDLPNGGVCLSFSAEEPAQLRGPQFHRAWCDELATFKQVRSGDDDATAWENLRIAVRLGQKPQILATTTPKRVPVLRGLLSEATAHPEKILIRRGKTYDNKYLSAAYLDVLVSLYGGTQLGRQELEGEMLDDVDGAMTSEAIINATRVRALPENIPWIKLISVDPSVAERPNDECGIVVIYISRTWPVLRRHAFIVDDLSIRASPTIWSDRVIAAAVAHDATVIAETNQGANLVFQMLRMAADKAGVPMPPMKEVWASKAKAVRAEPIGAAYARRRIHHVNVLPDLESQLTTWTASDPYSPDRLDACLIRGTQVTTARGPVPIETLTAGEMVWTRGGLRPVKRAWQTADSAQTYLVRTAEGRVCATADHLFWTDHGWTRLDALVQGDTLLTWAGIRERSLNGVDEPGCGTPITRVGTIGSTTSQSIGTAKHYTSLYGARPMVEHPSAMGSSSTMPTASRWTMPRRTWSVSTIHSTIRRILHWATSPPGLTRTGLDILSGLGNWPSHGTAVPRDRRGIALTVRRRGLTELQMSTPARLAELSTRRSSPVVRPAPAPANMRYGLLTAAAGGTTSASSAETPSELERGEPRPAVQSAVVLAIEKHIPAEVWDLEVAGVHEFFADGHLVHNCTQGCAAGLFPEALTHAGLGSTTLYSVAKQHIPVVREAGLIRASRWEQG